MSHSIIVKHFFDASHQLTDSPELVTKACARLHGHTYAVMAEVERALDDLNGAGMVVDFKAIKNVIDQLDHRHINDILTDQPTAENIAKWIYDQLTEQLNLLVEAVSVCEGYKGHERASWVVYNG